MDHIRIEDLEIYANHGVFREEQKLGQKFLVSVDMELCVHPAAQEDDLTKSVHYGEVAAFVDSYMKEHTFKLIETAADRLARQILIDRPLVKAVSVTVKKPWAPVGLPLDTVGVTAKRSRHQAVIALGSNLGDRDNFVQMGIEGLNSEGTTVVNTSSFYETKPMGPVEQGMFINACVLVETVLEPEELLDKCQAIEQAAGRVRLVHWGPRTLDLDIIYYDDLIINTDRLKIPHPEMHKRSFVLKPLSDICPDWVHPKLGKTTLQLLSDLPSDVQDRPQFDLEGLELVRTLPTEGAKVLYQGVPGAYAQAAMFKFFGDDVQGESVPEWSDACRAVAEGKAEYAVLPIENSNAGAVSQVMDLLLEYDIYIVGEEFLPVKHALLGLPDADMSDIKTVYSHPQALMQCAHYLGERRQWKQIALTNTAMSAKKVLDDADKSQAAIASEISARLYGLKILEAGINDNKNNVTRFVIISKRPIVNYGAEKISICVELNHEAGALYKLLSYISVFGLNMSKIESRPIPGRNFEYRFFIDFDGNVGREEVAGAMRMIRRASNRFWFLGNY